jgi:hypothetical protein
MDKNATFHMHGNGYYQCYCQLFSANSNNTDLCKEYIIDTAGAKNIGYCYSVLTVAVNYVLKVVIISICENIGFARKSKVTAVIMLVVMISTFINTALIRLVSSGSFKWAPFPFNAIPVDQEFPDFTHDWYMFEINGLKSTMWL